MLDVGYEYNINGNAAVDPLNPFALGNSLAAYIYGYGAESTALDITQKQNGDVVLHQADGPDVTLQPGTHYIVEDGNIVDELPAGTQDSTIYVTVDSGDLPLTRPLRLFPGGDILADALDPTLTALVDAGYADGKGTADNPAIPEDPTVTRPMQPGSSLTALGGVPSTLQDGATAGVQDGDRKTSPTRATSSPSRLARRPSCPASRRSRTCRRARAASRRSEPRTLRPPRSQPQAHRRPTVQGR